jgi:hypothetical protein
MVIIAAAAVIGIASSPSSPSSLSNGGLPIAAVAVLVPLPSRLMCLLLPPSKSEEKKIT